MNIEQIARRIFPEAFPKTVFSKAWLNFARRFLEEVDRQREAEGWVLVSREPTEKMLDEGAQGMALFQEDSDSKWPGSWEPLQVRAMKYDAKKTYRYMLAAAPKWEEEK